MEGPQRVAYLTAGAGGMFCGSCLNDNTLARALTKLGIDIQLVPTYTPIRTDEEDVSIDRVFFGGINVYLQQKIPLLRFLPNAFDGLLNNPRLIRWATRKDIQADPELLGGMTVSMLKGSAGFQRKEVRRLSDWLVREQPELISFSNVLIAGCAPDLKRRLDVPVTVTLQGDDIFLDFLPDKYSRQAVQQIRQISDYVDAFVTHSEYYRQFMGERLGIPHDKIHVVPLGIDARDFESMPSRSARPTKQAIGYLARLTPEKGLHVLVDAFIQLCSERDDIELRLAGWLGTEHQKFADAQFAKLEAAGADFHYAGVIERQDKIRFLRELDIFSVPTTYREPKGLFALEAMACGLPVVMPDHGAFPELITEHTGVLFRAHDARELARELRHLLDDRPRGKILGDAARASVLSSKNAEVMARGMLDVYQMVYANRARFSR